MAKLNNPLENLSVASPCHQGWDEMTGDERVRFCQACQLNVYNLSDMTQKEAQALLVKAEGRLCVRFYRREDGTVLTQDCPVGLSAIRRRVIKVAGLVLATLAGLLAPFGIQAFANQTGQNKEPCPVEIMGDVAAPPAIMGEMVAPPVQGKPQIQSPPSPPPQTSQPQKPPKHPVMGKIAAPNPKKQ